MMGEKRHAREKNKGQKDNKKKHNIVKSLIQISSLAK